MRRAILTAAAIAAMLPAVGCGGAGDRGKNKDLDRPRPADTKKSW